MWTRVLSFFLASPPSLARFLFVPLAFLFHCVKMQEIMLDGRHWECQSYLQGLHLSTLREGRYLSCVEQMMALLVNGVRARATP